MATDPDKPTRVSHDAEGDELSYALTLPPQVGELKLAGDGRFVYLPPPGFLGRATFRFRASDGTALSNPAQFTIGVIDCRRQCPREPARECLLAPGSLRYGPADQEIIDRHCGRAAADAGGG